MELVIVARSSIEEQILDLRKELHDLLEFPIEKLCEIIKEVGFECDMCSKCCTSDFNDHIFILDQEVSCIRNLPSDALEPAPYFEFVINTGTFYVSVIPARTKEDGSCIFLEGGRCNIYEHRPLICKCIHICCTEKQTTVENGLECRSSGLNEHNVYHSEITDEECIRIANLTIDYETAYLEHQICFLEKVNEHF